jgi:hypothetical protein
MACRAVMVPGLVLAVVVAGCGGRETDPYQQWRPLLAAEIAARGIDRPDDLYKFLHQGVMGPAHAAPDREHALDWLRREWRDARGAAVAGRPPLLAPLRPDGRLVRLDLVRLGAAAGHAPAVLDTVADVFVATGARWAGDPELLARLWTAVKADTALWRGHVAAIDLAHFDRELAGGWPAVHHSERYRSRHAPHYRVVDPTLLPEGWRP